MTKVGDATCRDDHGNSSGTSTNSIPRDKNSEAHQALQVDDEPFSTNGPK
jgi:hypothetical protein